MADFRKLDQDEIGRMTGGGLSRAIPAAKLLDMLRGRSGDVSCPHCREGIQSDATTCPHCHRDVASRIDQAF
jgi:hypothetical protein